MECQTYLSLSSSFACENVDYGFDKTQRNGFSTVSLPYVKEVLENYRQLFQSSFRVSFTRISRKSKKTTWHFSHASWPTATAEWEQHEYIQPRNLQCHIGVSKKIFHLVVNERYRQQVPYLQVEFDSFALWIHWLHRHCQLGNFPKTQDHVPISTAPVPNTNSAFVEYAVYIPFCIDRFNIIVTKTQVFEESIVLPSQWKRTRQRGNTIFFHPRIFNGRYGQGLRDSGRWIF